MLQEFLQRLLSGGAPAPVPNRLGAYPADMMEGPGAAGPAMLAFRNALEGMSAPQGAAPAGAPMAGPAPMPTPAPAPGIMGGLGGMIGDLINPGGAGRNQTIQWLQTQGMDEGTATLMASNKGALQNYLLDRTKGADPKAALEIAKLQLDIQDRLNPKRQTVTINGRLVDAQTGEEIASFPSSDAPTVQTIYDPATGMEKKVQWNPGSNSWEEIGGVKAPSGTSLQVDPTTGAVTFQQGQNVKPLTEAQSKDAVFATRAKGALPLIDQYGDALSSFGENLAGRAPLVGNYMKSEEYQKAEQAGKEFLQAILRKDTGAAITEGETREYGSVYLPQPGDSAGVLAQKKAARARALAAIEAGMPAAALLQRERALGNAPEGAPTQPRSAPAQPGGVMDYRDWLGTE